MSTGTSPLAKLIDEVKEANQWSDPDIVRRAVAAGHQISKSHISGIRIDGMVAIKGSLIRALAAGLGLPVGRVLRAALESLGLPTDNVGSTPEAAILDDHELSNGTKQMLLAMLREARKVGGDSRGYATPISEAIEDKRDELSDLDSLEE